jgi:hypothetical protein
MNMNCNNKSKNTQKGMANIAAGSNQRINFKIGRLTETPKPKLAGLNIEGFCPTRMEKMESTERVK